MTRTIRKGQDMQRSKIMRISCPVVTSTVPTTWDSMVASHSGPYSAPWREHMSDRIQNLQGLSKKMLAVMDTSEGRRASVESGVRHADDGVLVPDVSCSPHRCEQSQAQDTIGESA